MCAKGNKFAYKNMLNRIREHKITKNKNLSVNFEENERAAWNSAIELCYNIVEKHRQSDVSQRTVKEFIQQKYPALKNRMDADLLNNVSGNELVELINEYLRVGKNDVLHGVSSLFTTNELNDIVKEIFDSGIDEMKVLKALHRVNNR